MQTEAAAFLAWLLDRQPRCGHDAAFVIVALIHLSLESAAACPPGTVARLSEWALAEEERALEFLPEGCGTLYRQPMPAVWRRIGARLGHLSTRAGLSGLSKADRCAITTLAQLLQ